MAGSMSSNSTCEDDEPPLKKRKSDSIGRGSGEESFLSDHGGLEGQSAPVDVREEAVGISEYVSSHSGFFAILKRRYSDFMVHEVSPSGEVVQLTSYSMPIDANQFEADECELNRLLGADQSAAIKDLAHCGDKEQEVKIMGCLDKDERRVLHKTVRGLYPNLESETVDSESTPQHKIIVFRHAKGKTTQGDSRGYWPRERGSYCRFVLHKENKDTMEAIAIIARLLKMKSSRFRFAGLKDRRAITSQLITAFKVPAEKLQALNPTLRNIKLGNYKYVPDYLKLGDLSGNKFTIVLRNVSCDDHVVSEAVKSLSENGFVNYFGMQRFGTSTIKTHQIGRCLLHSNWKDAIDLILQPRPGESEEVESARKYYWESRDAAGALAIFPKFYYLERLLLQGLERHAHLKNYLGAFNFIPRNMRLMYVHGWQSYCWNKLVSWRLKKLGHSPVSGDMVIKQPSSSNSDEKMVEYVTEETKSSYNIHDVVLPLLGYDVQFPQNEVKAECYRMMEEEGVSIEQLQHRVKDFALIGSYRHIVTRPKNVTWESFLYDDLTIPLVQTDLDLISNKRPPQSIPDGCLKAVKLEFSLASSSYATMAIRELLKMETSSAFQTTLNQKCNES